MSSRYQIDGTWDHHAEREVSDLGEVIGVVTIETADLVDTRGGYRYHQGAHRVSIKSKLGGKPRGKTFKGETAWSDAERYAEDACWALKRLYIDQH